ncbi:WD repeat-containing and planar cell polarity effector protein fritz homolog isoform X2 [Sceloporus undulatus]|uniref:WD repeat-containing and planar cell polarity effector protein fritz homolog isoform X2 n=1 Tax=Sceloporus undulatus TaxID=8520 RepID=UPI001C4AC9E0|nr:WD repeat-containing and planar cell polarity effector protein fritz homolog isoform X2 [Sceloporus undulatus]
MTVFLCEMHLWSLKNTLHVEDEDIGIHHYYDKKESEPQLNFDRLHQKRQLVESRDYPWVLKNKRPEKLRDTLKELEELMQNSECVLSKWKTKYDCQLLFHSGVLVSLSLSGPQLERVVIDRTLMGKLISDTISDAVLTDSFMVLSFWEQNQLCYIQFTKKADSPDVYKKTEKLSSLDFKVVSYIRTSGDPLDVTFSSSQPYQIRTVEHSFSADQEPMADSCIYECVRSKVQCVAVTKIPLISKAISCCRNITEDKLILGCEDSSIVLYEDYRQLTLLAQAELLPTLMCCHPSGSIVLIGSSQGELQLFDMALSPIKMQFLAEDLSPKSTLQFVGRFNVSSSLSQIQWAVSQVSYETTGDAEFHNLLLLRFSKGPIGVLHFKTGVIPTGQLGLVEIIQEYIHQDEIYEAINVLGGMNWDTMGQQCFVSLSAIVNYLLRQKLTGEREAQLEATLGTFYAPTRPLAETTVLEYRDQISRYARRFFHHLLRYQRFEKAFLLALDIGAHDLFMDIHYFALDKGELALAEVAKKKANDIDTESITTAAEIPGYIDRGDALSEAFVDLSLLPQQERRVQSSLPASSTNTRSFPNSRRNSYTREMDKKEYSFIREVYTTLQRDKAAPWCQTETSEEEHDREVIGGSSSIKVVHFGLV